MVMESLQDLQAKIIPYFKALSKFPRGSGNEAQVSTFLYDFAQDLGLKVNQDAYNNIIVKKPGSSGYESAPTVILQGHMDMVCEKNRGTEHDFVTDPIEVLIDDENEYLYANGTTLGADNGIAMVYMMLLMEAKNISHPPLEFVFTTDEETGMQGARNLNYKVLDGKYLINLDSEEEGTLLMSSAGGSRCKLILDISREIFPDSWKSYRLFLKGLKGGHSGEDINQFRGNANKLIARIINQLNNTLSMKLISLNGGAKDNAIPREAEAIIGLKEKDFLSARQCIDDLVKIINHEYKRESLEYVFEEDIDSYEFYITKESAKAFIDLIRLTPNGIQSMSSEIEGLVECSLNLGVVNTYEEEAVLTFSNRSSLGSKLDELQAILEDTASLFSAESKITGRYPEWQYNPESLLRDVFVKTYEELYHKTPKLRAIHAGLECGIFAANREGLDIISIGPNMYDIHSPKERLSIPSSYRTFEYLIHVLENIK